MNQRERAHTQHSVLYLESLAGLVRPVVMLRILAAGIRKIADMRPYTEIDDHLREIADTLDELAELLTE